MESVEVKKRGRGRPRKRRRPEDEKKENNDKNIGSALKRRAMEIWSKPLVGRFVMKEFEGNGIFLGKIVQYDTGLYRVEYEDGDCEDLDSGELRSIIVGDNDIDDGLVGRMRRLDELLVKKNEARKELEKQQMEKLKDEATVTEVPKEIGGVLRDEDDGGEEDDGDSSSDSCDYAQVGDLGVEEEAPLIPPPQLPPSSGNVGVQEEYVSHLFSVYAFLRSFNVQLFLSPFSLDDLVGAINCRVQNTLLDSIHVVLLRAIRRRLETLSTDGLELASKCLRSMDWNLLDLLTWPVFLVNYFTVMGYSKGLEWKGFHDDFLQREYYLLTAGRKLMILQILCDDVLDSAEMRSEIDAREESEFGIDPDSAVNGFAEGGPRRLHPRFSKTSAGKDRGVVETIAEIRGTKSSQGPNCEGGPNALIDNSDENSDDCRLCGMDGTLLCCDGCPAAYHSRCIGVAKMYIPDGPWYCPECIINRMGPYITMGTSLKGAEVFGIDVYQQVFMGSCDHLLVLRAFADKHQCIRYYGQKDIPKVLHSLCASEQHRPIYMEICKLIAQYWDIPEIPFCSAEGMGKDLNTALVKENVNILTASTPAWGISQRVPDVTKADNPLSSNGKASENISVSCVDTLGETAIPSLSSIGTTRTADLDRESTKLPEQIKVEGAISGMQADQSGLTHQSPTCNSANSNSSHVGLASGTALPAIMSSQRKDASLVGPVKLRRYLGENPVYVGASFKPKAYINHYAHGDFSASAAAALAVLSSEDARGPGAHRSKTKKANHDISVQMKAFSKVASRFFWPSSERKLIEVPRERCGWCHSCKVVTSSKRGCMLNSAGLILTKGALKVIGNLRPTLTGDGSLPSISTYIMYVGVTLSGLTTGPFLSASYKKQWLKRVEDASSCSTLKGLLLELEENIRRIALSADWFKAVDNCVTGSFITESAATETRGALRRGPTGKRHKKQPVSSDNNADSSDGRSFVWWRVGSILKHVFNNAVLPKSMLKNVARQGGSRKIPGLCYTDDSEVPKRSRQLTWRAAVEECKNLSQLALQVRYLDVHVRWSDLTRSELNAQDSKGSETEASVFRNAVISDKEAEEKNIIYGVVFENQKHLPSRVMKNVIRTEQKEGGNNKYWFSESYVPLYLIKEYEGKREVVLPQANKSNSVLSELQRKQLKASRRDIFSFLECRRDGVEKCSCASCQRDVPLRNTVECSACHGYCHKDCTVRSTAYRNNVAVLLLICNRCCNARAAYMQYTNKSPTTPLPSRGPELHSVSTLSHVTKPNFQNQLLVAGKSKEISPQMINDAGAKAKVQNQSLGSVKMQQPPAAAPASASKHSKIISWGIIWKKSGEDTGVNFRREKVIVKGCPNGNRLRPKCEQCKKEYDPNLMYISCESCSKWLHAEAVELEESRLPDVVGFKCCRCRRIKTRRCPYKEEEPLSSNKANRKKSSRKKLAKQENQAVDYDPGTPMFFPMQQQPVVPSDDPLLHSITKVEQIPLDQKLGVVDAGEWEDSNGPGPRKLPVRRQTKHQEGETDVQPLESSSLLAETSSFITTPADQECDATGMDWDGFGNGAAESQLLVGNDEGFNFEDMEFEPQTYFSFTELLEEDEADQLLQAQQSGAAASASVAAEAFPDVALTGWNEYKPVPEPAMGSQDPVSDVFTNITPCQFCSKLDPPPELACEICGLIMHNHCAVEVGLSYEGNWRCGGCREWR
ncbi:DDT domain-containing protein PTM [Linum perenne]